MTISEALEKIGKALGILTHQTHAENRGGMFSKNSLTEDLLLPVFRYVLKAPYLRNANNEAINFPDIDLVDDRSRLVVQVTTERRAEKVTATLTNFIAKGCQKRYNRFVFFILTGERLRYTSQSKRKWQRICRGKLRFNPSSDIIATLDLLPLVKGLPPQDVYSVQEILDQTVVGEKFIDVESYLTLVSRQQLDYEKQTGKYIPDIFIETRETKNLARSFTHPSLFFNRTLDSLSRLNITSWNRFLAKAGLPPLPFPDLSPPRSAQTLSDVTAAVGPLLAQLAELTGILEKYEKTSRKKDPPFPIKRGREYFYEQNIFTLQSSLGWGLKSTIKDFVDELTAVQARVFILTGRAGQGKTNLVCDFVENFLLKHRIPCAYLTGRQLRATQAPDLGDAIQKLLLFDGKTSSFSETAHRLSAYASRINKPFILIIDGLNEHHKISEFAEQLQYFIGNMLKHSHLKLLLTCRSEFFQQRFGALTQPPLQPYTFLWEANEHRVDDEFHDEMMAAYFQFFSVRDDLVSNHARESLKKDILLLRFFCEAYGAKNKPSSYQQPFIANIYREDIFKSYLERKLGTADIFFQRFTGRVRPTSRKSDLLTVLEYCVKHMLNVWQFVNVPVTIIPANLNDALYALLDEELILRRDAPPSRSIFSTSEETINFTFDEFRDFLLAQYLLTVYESDRALFDQYVARNDPKDSQVVEGLKRFLFYASRHTENEEFWKTYRNQHWYEDVYDYEVFNIDPSLLRAEDRNAISGALQAGGQRASTLARRLAVCWHVLDYPVLNLDLLLSIVVQSDDNCFDDLIVKAFKTTPHFNDGSSASAFSAFIIKHVLPEFKVTPQAPETSLFRFLILLLPVDSSFDLNSGCYDVFRKLLDLHPAYGIHLLKESLQYKPTQYRPYVWRLLASDSLDLSRDEALLAEARSEKERSATKDSVLNREVTRFLERYSQTVGDNVQ